MLSIVQNKFGFARTHSVRRKRDHAKSQPAYMNIDTTPGLLFARSGIVVESEQFRKPGLG